eukprot:scaffold649680_cov36-Prasinocladus_malaysianus.AAC.2
MACIRGALRGASSPGSISTVPPSSSSRPRPLAIHAGTTAARVAAASAHSCEPPIAALLCAAPTTSKTLRRVLSGAAAASAPNRWRADDRSAGSSVSLAALTTNPTSRASSTSPASPSLLSRADSVDSSSCRKYALSLEEPEKPPGGWLSSALMSSTSASTAPPNSASTVVASTVVIVVLLGLTGLRPLELGDLRGQQARQHRQQLNGVGNPATLPLQHLQHCDRVLRRLGRCSRH